MAKQTQKQAAPDQGLGIKRERQIKNRKLVATRRAQIMKAALKLFLQKGPDNTTIVDIAKASGVNPASIYDYVENKAHILRLLFDEMLGMSPQAYKELVPDIEVTDPASLESFLRQLINNAWVFRPETILLAYRATYLLDKKAKKRVMLSDLKGVAKRAEMVREAYGLDGDDDRPFIAMALATFLHAFFPLRSWMLRDHDPQRVLEVTTEVLMNGINGLMEK